MNVVYPSMRKRLEIYSFIKTLELKSTYLEDSATFFLLTSWKFVQSYSRKKKKTLIDICAGHKFSFLDPGDYENSDEVMSMVQWLVQGDTSVIRTAHDVGKQVLLSLGIRQTWLYYILASATQEAWGRDCTSPNPSFLYLNWG